MEHETAMSIYITLYLKPWSLPNLNFCLANHVSYSERKKNQAQVETLAQKDFR